MPCPRRKRRLVIAALCGVFLCALAAHGSVRRVFRVLSSAKYSWAEASSSSFSSSSFTNSSPAPSAAPSSSWSSSSSLRAQGQFRDVKEDNRKKKPAPTKGDPPQVKTPPGGHHNPAKHTRNNNPYSFPPPPPPPHNTSSSRLFTTPARSPHPHQSFSSLTTSQQRRHQQQQASNLKPQQPPPPPKQKPSPSPRKANLSSASGSRQAQPRPHLASSRRVKLRVKLRDILYPTEVSHVLRPFPSNPLQLFSGYNVSGESPALLGDLYQRYLRVEKACSAVAASAGAGTGVGAGVGSEKRGKVAGIFKDDASRVAYCYLPKAGCTFWIRVFSYLHNFTGDSPKSPWDIPRLKLHNNPNSHGVLWSVLREGIHDHLRFMFVRHPFSRLWSAYVDKFFLPDFWQIGTQAVRKLRGPAAAALSPRSAGCGSDVTFPEFVAFSLTSDEPHWAPIYQRCDPCLFKPAVVGSMKTFSRDNLFLLRRMGLEWVLKDVDLDSQKEKEIATLITYNFERIHSIPFYRSCVNDSELTRLLWKAFQINGYIPDDAPVPALSAAAASSSSSGGAGVAVRVREFQGQVLGVFRAAWPRRRELKLQKERYLRQALASLPPRLMAKVKRKYMPDMVYFGFNDTNY